jgi:hypothetical protein
LGTGKNQGSKLVWNHLINLRWKWDLWIDIAFYSSRKLSIQVSGLLNCSVWMEAKEDTFVHSTRIKPQDWDGGSYDLMYSSYQGVNEESEIILHASQDPSLTSFLLQVLGTRSQRMLRH